MPVTTLKEVFALDKLQRLGRMVKQSGGMMQVLRKLYVYDDLKLGEMVGTDKFGNKYFSNPEYFVPKDRWVEFAKGVWLDYDASQIPPEWHRWLHHMTDHPPTTHPPVDRPWIMQHEENLSGTDQRYVPYSTTRPKVEGWVPPPPKNK